MIEVFYGKLHVHVWFESCPIIQKRKAELSLETRCMLPSVNFTKKKQGLKFFDAIVTPTMKLVKYGKMTRSKEWKRGRRKGRKRMTRTENEKNDGQKETGTKKNGKGRKRGKK